ncbi:MAG: hypothetical protein L6V93_04955 [Clostridiales bacterium]|nr:MAG: hypothetical protein L6V93_04955 [Clostridiales bacterium]
MTLDLGTDKITLYDAYGNKEEISGANGIYSFDLSKRIKYIEGDFKSFTRVTGGVFPADTEINAVYGEEIKIPIVNYTGKNSQCKKSFLMKKAHLISSRIK